MVPSATDGLANPPTSETGTGPVVSGPPTGSASVPSQAGLVAWGVAQAVATALERQALKAKLLAATGSKGFDMDQSDVGSKNLGGPMEAAAQQLLAMLSYGERSVICQKEKGAHCAGVNSNELWSLSRCKNNRLT